MRKLTASLLRLLSLTVVVVYASMALAQSYPERLYCSNDRVGWWEPLVENQDKFQIAEKVGNGVYEIYFDQPTDRQFWFSLYTELLSEVPEDGTSYFRNRVQMVDEAGVPTAEHLMTPLGRSGVSGDKIRVFPMFQGANAFSINYDCPTLVRINLAEGYILAIPDNAVIMLGSNEAIPQFDTFKNHTGAAQGAKYFVPSGGRDFYMYRPADNKLYGNGGVEIDNGNAILKFAQNDTPFNISGWNGGIWKFIGATDRDALMSLIPLAEEGLNYSDYTGLQAIGDFCNWDFNSAVSAEEHPGNGLMIVDVPAGAQTFKFACNGSWNDNLGIDPKFGFRINGDGMLTARLIKNGANIDFLKPAQADVKCILYIEDEYVTFSLADGTSPEVEIAGEMIDPSYGGVYDPLKEDVNVWLSTPEDDIAEAKFENIGVFNRSNKVFDFDGVTYTLTTYINDINFDLRIITKLGETESETKVVCPADDGVLEPTQYVVTRKAVESTLPASKGWTLRNGSNTSREVKISYTPGSGEVTFDFGTPNSGNELPDKIYLVGSPQGWNIMSDEMPLTYTDKGTYYGEFPVEAGSAPTFRFYTKLGDWGSDYSLPSIGSSGMDFDTTEINSNGTYVIMHGKGNWSIPDWSGTTMYIEVSLTEMWMRFSDTPIEHGNPAEPKTSSLVVYANGNYTMLNDINGGNKFDVNIYGDEVWLFPEMPRYDVSDPRWVESAYSIKPLYSLPESGVVAYSVAEGNGEGNPVSNINGVVRMDGDKLYIVPQDLRYYVIDDEQRPTLHTLADFESRIMPRSGMVKPHPLSKGDHIVRLIDMSRDENYVISGDFDMADAVVKQGEDYRTLNELKIQNWPGGDILIRYGYPTILLNVSKLTQLEVATPRYNADTEEIEYLTRIVERVEDQPGIFEFDSDVPVSKQGQPYTAFSVRVPDVDYLYIGSLAYFSGTGNANESGSMVIFSGNEAEKRLRLGGNPFDLPELTGGKFHVRYDLNSMTAKFTAESENILTSEAFTLGGEDNSVIRYSAPAPYTHRGMRTASLGTLRAQEYTLTIGNTGTSAAASNRPAFNRKLSRTLSFNDYGVAEATLSTGSAEEWNFIVPEYSSATLCIDKEAGKLRLFVEAYSKAFYPSYDTGNGNSATLENLGYSYPNAMVIDHDDQRYKGVINLPVKDGSVIFQSMLNTGLVSLSPRAVIFPVNDNVIDLGDIKPGESVEIPVATFMTFLYGWNVKSAPAEGLIAEFDPEESILRLKYNDGSGIDEIPESGQVSVRGLKGCISINGEAGHKVDIYDLQGMKKADVITSGEELRISLPAGLYVSNYGKIIVR